MSSGTDTPNVIFFGTEDFSLIALRALVENGYTVALVITKPDSPYGRGLKIREPAVKTYALAHGIAVLQPAKLQDIHDDIAAVPNRAGVLSAYGKIVPASILDLFTTGITNIHPSLLPLYRGPSPIETAVFNGDSETGVSLMRLVVAMDAGPVYAQKAIALSADGSAPELYETLGRIGASLLIEYLPRIIAGDVTGTDQPDDRATYTTLLRPSDAVVNKSVQSADVIDRHVRAYASYPRTKMVFGEVTAIVTKVHVVSKNEQARDNPGLIVGCADDTWLRINEVIAPSGRRMDGVAFKNGYVR